MCSAVKYSGQQPDRTGLAVCTHAFGFVFQFNVQSVRRICRAITFDAFRLRRAPDSDGYSPDIPFRRIHSDHLRPLPKMRGSFKNLRWWIKNKTYLPQRTVMASTGETQRTAPHLLWRQPLMNRWRVSTRLRSSQERTGRQRGRVPGAADIYFG